MTTNRKPKPTEQIAWVIKAGEVELAADLLAVKRRAAKLLAALKGHGYHLGLFGSDVGDGDGSMVADFKIPPQMGQDVLESLIAYADAALLALRVKQ